MQSIFDNDFHIFVQLFTCIEYGDVNKIYKIIHDLHEKIHPEMLKSLHEYFYDGYCYDRFLTQCIFSRHSISYLKSILLILFPSYS